MHYMRSDPARARQLDAATQAISEGDAPVKAFEKSTGLTMAELTFALKQYRKLPVTTMTLNALETPAMSVTPLPPSADDLFIDNLHLIMAPTGNLDPELLQNIRRKAAKYPGDALAERVLARAEFVMGDGAAGEAIMTRRLAAKADDKEDLLLAGTGQIMIGMRDATQQDARYKAARAGLGKAYQLDKTDFRTLYAYALSRSIEPKFPTDNDLTVLLEARALAPSVTELSARAGFALLSRGRREEAARMLAVVINNPHGGQAAEQARRALNQGQIGKVDIEPFTGEDEPATAPEPGKPKPLTRAR